MKSGSPSRDRLLAAAVDYVAEHGLGDLSLRQLATALGTSHRMLIYHFGSKQGLLVEVIKTVEGRQREIMAAMAAESAASGERPGAGLRRMWDQLADPVNWPHERLFFEIYGQALQGRPQTSGLLDDIVSSWTDTAPLGGQIDAGERAWTRLGLAVYRGLLLDLLATGDRDAVDAAVDQFIGAYESWLSSVDVHGR
jgi:AcrR family transcriptional regulator